MHPSLFGVNRHLGSSAILKVTYLASRPTDPKAPPIAAILKSAAVSILPGNDHCGAQLGSTVAEVLGGVLDAGLGRTRNPYSHSCRGETCRFEISNCMGWRDTDCGETMLEFSLDGHGAPRVDSFACLGAP